MLLLAGISDCLGVSSLIQSPACTLKPTDNPFGFI